MSDNGSGVYSPNTGGQPVAGNTDILDSVFNNLINDIATALTNRICKDGQTTITANIPFNDKKITGLAAGTARTDGASLATIQDGTGVYVATVGGSANAITLTPSPAITAYVAGQTFRFIAAGANTSSVTVAVSGLAAKAIEKNGATALIAGDIPSGMMAQITYDGTRFVLGAVAAPSVGTWTPSLGGNATYTAQVGNWTKVGNLVFVQCRLVVNVLGTGSPTLISGLPFTFTGRATGAVYFAGLATAVTSLVAILANTTDVAFQTLVAAATSSGGGSLIFTNGTEVNFSLTYNSV